MARPMAACAGVHRDLPDEQDVGPVGQHISGDKTVDASSGAFGQDTVSLKCSARSKYA